MQFCMWHQASPILASSALKGSGFLALETYLNLLQRRPPSHLDIGFGSITPNSAANSPSEAEDSEDEATLVESAPDDLIRARVAFYIAYHRSYCQPVLYFTAFGMGKLWHLTVMYRKVEPIQLLNSYAMQSIFNLGSIYSIHQNMVRV